MTLTIERAETQYLRILEALYREGVLVTNRRTGSMCYTLINQDLVYDARTDAAPILTTRKLNVKGAIAELLGYLKGFTSAAQFRALGTRTWDANANQTPSWVNNPNRKGPDDLGLVYGAVAAHWPVHSKVDSSLTPWHYETTGTLDLIETVYQKLRNKEDDRGLIITFYHPGLFHLGALRPCLYEHQFSLVDNTLYLNSTQR